MLEAGEYTMKRFAALYGMTYGGMATSKADAAKLGKSIYGGIFYGVCNSQ